MAQLDKFRFLPVTEWRKGHWEMAIVGNAELAQSRDGVTDLRQILRKLLGLAC